MSKVNKIKEWLRVQMKNKKFVIMTIVFLVLLVAVVFGLTISFSGILGSTYDVNSIGKNIDKIKIGDTINYTANGYSDWEVLNINKEDNTIDIVSKTPVEDLTIKVEDIDNYYDILQNTANKYLDSKYAISARSVSESDLEKYDNNELHWINKKTQKNIYYNFGKLSVVEEENSIRMYSIIPIVTLNVQDTYSLKAGDIYNYSLNGIDKWKILYIDDPTSISIVPIDDVSFEVYDTDIVNFQSLVDNEIMKFNNGNIVGVRNFSMSDIDALRSIYLFRSETLYTGKVECAQDVVNGTHIFDRCFVERVWNNYNSSNMYPQTMFLFGWRNGFVPVVTIKYSDEEKNGKDMNSELKVGDYVKYSANGYNNWKVLNINKDNNTVDVISGGIVKNITVDGVEGYENFENILQAEADKYKVGNNVISARSVRIDDFDNLKLMKDSLQARFFLSNKKEYRINDEYNAVFSYSCAVGSYDISIGGLKYDWAILADKTLHASSSSFSDEPNRYYRYTAGLRPIITLKLSAVKEFNNKDVSSYDNSLVEEQNKANQSAQETITNEEIEKAEKVEENQFDSEKELEDFVLELAETVNKLNTTLKGQEEKNKMFVIFLVTNLVLTVGVAIVSKFRK